MRIREAVDPYDRKTSSYIVAYMDILGATNRINQSSDSQNAALNTLHNLYTFAMGLAAKDGIRNYAGIKFKIFPTTLLSQKSCKKKTSNKMSPPCSTVYRISYVAL